MTHSCHRHPIAEARIVGVGLGGMRLGWPDGCERDIRLDSVVVDDRQTDWPTSPRLAATTPTSAPPRDERL